ncbi:MAG: DUF3798 domain-containing protein, partial [Candidatus Adiutrix sp.]|nr:DUF3798 domain-containing protein [Candidatus Adiutrix sp.]
MDKPQARRNTWLTAFLLGGLALGWIVQPACWAAEEPAFHIGIMTSAGSQSREELRGAREMIRLYGDAARGGLVRHVTYPENFLEDIETT